MKKLSIFISVLFAGLSLQAQERTSVLRYYYEINEVYSESNFKRLDSLARELGTGSATISLYGHADFLGNPVYNMTLSKKRAEAVKKHLFEKAGPRLYVKICTGEGENKSRDNGSAEGEPQQRRVDLLFTSKDSAQRIAERIDPVRGQAPQTGTPVVTKPVVKEKGIEDLKPGESLKIEGLNFIPGRHLVTKSAFPAMKKLLKTLRDHPAIKVEIQGHVCCPGDGHPDGLDYDTHTYNLSETRAKAIYDFLVRNGIDESRLTYKGYGRSNMKILVETSPEEEQMNRRVEIRVLEK